MIVSHGRQFVFVHIPKTGGTSLALALEARAMKDDILIGDTPKAVKRRHRVKALQAEGRLWKHARLADLHGLLDPAQMERYFVFTLVRNPWDRMVSYYHWLRDQSFAHPQVTLARSLGFSEFLNDRTTRAILARDGASRYVQDKTGVDRCDLYLRLEHLAEDLPRLEAGIGLKLGPLPHVNRSAREGYQSYYSAADAALVADLFAQDVARFGYRFAPVAP